jgi:hypothetical protein
MSIDWPIQPRKVLLTTRTHPRSRCVRGTTQLGIALLLHRFLLLMIDALSSLILSDDHRPATTRFFSFFVWRSSHLLFHYNYDHRVCSSSPTGEHRSVVITSPNLSSAELTMILQRSEVVTTCSNHHGSLSISRRQFHARSIITSLFIFI